MNDQMIEVTVTVPELTAAGLAWATANSDKMAAKVAIAGEDWPAPHRRIAVGVCNSEGAKGGAA